MFFFSNTPRRSFPNNISCVKFGGKQRVLRGLRKSSGNRSKPKWIMKTCNEIKMGAITWRCFSCHVVICHSVGSRGGARGPRLPLIFRPNWVRLEGPKKNFLRPGPPLSQGLDEPGPPYLKIWTRHCIMTERWPLEADLRRDHESRIYWKLPTKRFSLTLDYESRLINYDHGYSQKLITIYYLY